MDAKTYYEERIEHYRAMGECYGTAVAWAKLDTEAKYGK